MNRTLAAKAVVTVHEVAVEKRNIRVPACCAGPICDGKNACAMVEIRGILVIARADQEMLVARLGIVGRHDAPVGDGRAQIVVVPAAPMEHRYLDALITLKHGVRLPERRWQGIGHEFIEVGGRCASGIGHFGHRQVPIVQLGKILIGLVGHGDRPGADCVHLQASITHCRLVTIQADVAGRHADQGFMTTHRTGVTRKSEIGFAPHADTTIRPRLTRDPVDRVIAIRDFVAGQVGLEQTFGSPLASDILHHRSVALAHPVVGDDRHDTIGLGLAIGHACQDRRKGTIALRQIDIGGESRAIAHNKHLIAKHGSRLHSIGQVAGNALIGGDLMLALLGGQAAGLVSEHGCSPLYLSVLLCA